MDEAHSQRSEQQAPSLDELAVQFLLKALEGQAVFTSYTCFILFRTAKASRGICFVTSKY